MPKAARHGQRGGGNRDEVKGLTCIRSPFVTGFQKLQCPGAVRSLLLTQ